MRRRLGCVAILVYPFVEVALAIVVARWVGWWWVLVYAVLCLVLGLGLVRYALGATGRSFGLAIASLRAPGEPTQAMAIEGPASARSAPPAQTLLIVPAGALIAAPGFITTAVGLLLWLPPLRARIAARIERTARRWDPPGGRN